MKTGLRLLLATALLATFAGSTRGQPATVEIAEGSLRAQLTVEDSEAALAWRFERQIERGITEMTPSHNGRPLPLTTVRGYPMEGDVTAALFVIDVTGPPERNGDIFESKALTLGAYNLLGPHHQVGFAKIDGGLLLATGSDDAPIDPIQALLSFDPSYEGEATLFSALGFAIEQVGAIPAARRAVFVFTDGYSDEEMDYPLLLEVARELDVAVIVYALPSVREADMEPLERFAAETGGAFHSGPEAVSAALQNPFQLVDSGGSAAIDLSPARRYFWDGASRLDVEIRLGSETVTISSTAAVPDATPTETISYLWDHHGNTIGFSLAGLGWLAALVLLPFALRRRGPAQRSAVAAADAPSAAAASAPAGGDVPSAPARPAATAGSFRLTWADTASGKRTGFAVNGPRVTIGRARDNTIVIADDTVSGHQAVLTRTDSGAYSLVNLSETNPTLVNDEAVQIRELKAGDRLRFGLVEARLET